MSCAGRKYANHAQLVQCVGRVNDPTLTLSERSFLNCLAAHSVSGNPHPGNAILMIWCGVRTRQGLNKISDRLRSRGLLELIQEGRGRGEQHANVWRIRLDDDRFPEHPKNHKQPSLFPPLKPQLQSCPFPEEKTATPEAENRNSAPVKPQLGSAKTATLELHPDVKNGCKERIEEEAAKPRPLAEAAKPAAPPVAFNSPLFVVNEAQDAKLADVYPWVDRPQEYKKMALWLTANRPGRKVHNVLAFAQNWFNKIPCPSMQKGGTNGKPTATDLASHNFKGLGLDRPN